MSNTTIERVNDYRDEQEALWESSRIMHGEEPLYTVEVQIAVGENTFTMQGFVVCERSTPTAATVIFPVTNNDPREKTEENKAYLDTTKQMSETNLRALGLKDTNNAIVGALEKLDINRYKVGIFNLSANWETNLQGEAGKTTSDICISGAANSCWESLFPLAALSYEPAERCDNFAQSLGSKLGWKVTPVKIGELD